MGKDKIIFSKKKSVIFWLFPGLEYYPILFNYNYLNL